MDDYVPQEDFFDDNILAPIDEVGKEAKTKKNEAPKASINLPKRVKGKQDSLKIAKPNFRKTKKPVKSKIVTKE